MITVEVTGLPNLHEYPNLQTWAATGAGECERGDRESRSSSAANCTHLPARVGLVQDEEGTTATATVDIQSLCEIDGIKQLYFLSLPSDSSGADTDYFDVLTLAVDTTAPESPRKLEATRDKEGLTLSWSAPASQTTRYVVLVDTAAKADEAGGCTSELLRSQRSFSLDDLKDLPEGASFKLSFGEQSVSLDSAALGSSDSAAAAVIALDRAGNTSAMSDVLCLSPHEPEED